MADPGLRSDLLSAVLPLFHFPNKPNIFLAGGNSGFTLKGKWGRFLHFVKNGTLFGVLRRESFERYEQGHIVMFD
jgi:hypothetical protein